MEPIRSDDMEGFHLADESSEQLNSPYSSYFNGLYGEPEALPRVGDQYQAEISDLIPEDDRLKLISRGSSETYPRNPFSLGLPIPLMWTRSEKFKGFHETNADYVPHDNDPLAKADDQAASSKVRTIVLALPCQRNIKFKFEWLDKSINPFPGTLGDSWEDAEQKRLLLGLYCLGKNLAFVQRFVGSKSMGDVLSYYYGGFYRSSQYKRWADGRSLRSRRSVQGHKLFTGWRQQELLSRISSHVPEECKSMLLEVSKAFREEKIALEEYVFALKNACGTDILIEAIGIGKGKKDLTNGALEPPKTSMAASGNSEVPIGKACSSLSPADIVRYLTGGFRLSKARSSDLFWEAVWPRLLARGWHSEQPRGHARNSLVFLIPGASKFSRRRMVKGNHYFDSVTDVLNKVASDPTLLELDAETIRDNGKREEKNGNDEMISSDGFDDSSPNSKRQRYLQPRRTSSKNLDVLMFTIVDTSTIYGPERCMLREMRCLPVESGVSSSTYSPNLSSESEDNLSEDSENEAERKSKPTNMRACGDSSVWANGAKLSFCKTSSLNVSTGTVVSRSSVSLNENRQKKNRKVKPNSPKSLSFRGKRSSYSGETLSRKKKTKNKERQMRPNSQDAHQDVIVRDENRDEACKLYSDSSIAEGSSTVRNADVTTTFQRHMSMENHETREHLDTNVAQVLEGHEAESTVVAETVQNGESSQSSVKMNIEEEHTGRRQSTRSRPLTAKALEAFAFGFLGSPKKKKRKDMDGSRDNRSSRSKSTRRHHTVVTSEFRNGTVNDVPNTVETDTEV
ncbi:PREDICTED: uncharacterized protein LOC104802160 isoform X2 [Tarenaya hassleriana]|nr:PREDICTED: uncharacterized protein LOC104802160 isoform X2 [Tarenaya hassleriana]